MASRLVNQKPDAEVLGSYANSAKMVSAYKVDRCLHSIYAERPALTETSDEEVVHLPQARILAAEVHIDVLR